MLPYALHIVIILMKIPYSSLVRDMCKGESGITTFHRFKVSDQVYCIFEPPNQESVVKQRPQNNGYDLDIDQARRLCQQYDAGVLQIESKEIYKTVMEILKPLPSAYYPLGVKHQQVETIPYDDNSVADLTMNLTWDNGKYNIFWTRGLYDTFWDYAYTDGVTLVMVIRGSFATVDPTIPRAVVVLICHQEQDDPVTTSPKDICADAVPSITKKARFMVAGKWHCIFRPPGEAEVMKHRIIGNISGYHFKLDDLKEHCKKYDARLPQLYNAEIHRQFRNESEKIANYREQAPVGIKEKHVINGTAPPTVTIIHVFWDSGAKLTLRHAMAFSSTIWTIAPGGTVTFLHSPNGSITVLDPGALQGPVALLCHQDPKFPIVGTGPPIPIAITTTTSACVKDATSSTVALLMMTPGLLAMIMLIP